MVTAGDLTVNDSGNKLVKFADDTYLVIPATNVSTRTTEIENVELWPVGAKQQPVPEQVKNQRSSLQR